MPRNIKSGLIQMSLPMTEGEGTIAEIMDAMVQKHIPLIKDAGKQGVQILCLQEIFNTPYFCPGQDNAWYASAETIPGPTTEQMQEYAKKYNMVIIVPIYEKEQAGVLYNTAAVIDADGTFWGNTGKIISPIRLDFGKNIFSNLAIWVTLFLKQNMRKWVSIFVMIDISQMGQGVLG